MEQGRKRESFGRWISRQRFALLAFFVPFLTLLFGFVALQLFPFGKNTILTIDMYHQYAPFFSLLREKLLTGGSLFYSWDTGLGTNFWGLIGYYLASPLNCLIVLFPRDMLTEAMAFITLLKVGTMGLSFHLFVKGVFQREDLSNVIFAVMYALCSYVVAYSWNIMWMDCLALMPLALLGLERMLKGGRPWLYCISLGLAIISNFYVSFMVAVYMVLYFFAHLFVHRDSPDRALFWKKVGRFTLYSLVCGGLSAILSVPTFIALQGIASTNLNPPAWDGSLFKMAEILSQHLSFIEPSVMSGLPNVACGTLALMMVPVYWTGKSDTREKIAATAILGILFVLFQASYPNYAMHGMRYPNSLNHRFAFLYCFTLVVMAWRGFHQLEGRSAKILGWLFAGMMGLIIFAQSRDGSPVTMVIAYANVLIVVGYLAVLAVYKAGKLPQVIAYTLILFLTCTELVVQWPMYRSVAGRETLYVEHDSISETMNKVEQLDDDAFYRVEKLEPHWTSNDCAWFGYKGICQFSSMAYSGMAQLMRRLGLSNNGLNSFFQDSSLPTLNAILGVRYLVNEGELETGTLLERVEDVDGYRVYRNPYALSLGYMVSGDIRSWNIQNNNTFTVQNQFFQKAAGVNGVLKLLNTSNYTAERTEIRNSNITGEWLGGYYFDRTGSENGTVRCEISNDAEQPVFLYISTKNSQEVGKFVATKPDGERQEINYGENHVIPLGVCPEGKIQLEMTLDASDTGYFMVSACTVDREKLEEAIGKLREREMTVASFRDTRISGTVKTDRKGVLFLSIPYDEGWTVKVDGQKTDKLMIGEGLLGVELEEGEHRVELSYIPEGFLLGLALTLVSLAFLVVMELLRRMQEKRPAPEPAFLTYAREHTPTTGPEEPWKQEEAIPTGSQEIREETTDESADEREPSEDDHDPGTGL